MECHAGSGRLGLLRLVRPGTGAPADCLVKGQPCDGVRPDEADPTRPAPLTIDTSGGITLRWAASTDDRQLRHYEMSESGTVLATTSAASYVLSAGNTLPPRVYLCKVRAIHMAGNYSAGAYASLCTPRATPWTPVGWARSPESTCEWRDTTMNSSAR